LHRHVIPKARFLGDLFTWLRNLLAALLPDTACSTKGRYFQQNPFVPRIWIFNGA
jgi:hypothetical protein